MNDAAVAMTQWQCHKKVFANKIVDIKALPDTDLGRISLDNTGYVDVEHDWLAKHKPIIGGYYVVYEDGYKSYSPAEPFESGYTQI